jgi:hypothetical protein
MPQPPEDDSRRRRRGRQRFRRGDCEAAALAMHELLTERYEASYAMYAIAAGTGCFRLLR